MAHRASHGVLPRFTDPLFRFVVYAENQEPQYFEVKIDRAEVLNRRRMIVEASPREAF
jgi:hypothetical protein